MATSPTLELFKFDACPFCQMVMDHIESRGIKVIYCDISQDQKHLERLVADTGRRTTPCLYIDNKPMFESRDIMLWIDQNLELLEKR